MKYFGISTILYVALRSNLRKHVVLFLPQSFKAYLFAQCRRIENYSKITQRSFCNTPRILSHKMEPTNADTRSQQHKDGTESSSKSSLLSYSFSLTADSSFHLDSCHCEGKDCSDCDYKICTNLLEGKKNKKARAKKEKFRKKKKSSNFPRKDTKSLKSNEVSNKTMAKSTSTFQICICKI